MISLEFLFYEPPTVKIFFSGRIFDGHQYQNLIILEIRADLDKKGHTRQIFLCNDLIVKQYFTSHWNELCNP